ARAGKDGTRRSRGFERADFFRLAVEDGNASEGTLLIGHELEPRRLCAGPASVCDRFSRSGCRCLTQRVGLIPVSTKRKSISWVPGWPVGRLRCSGWLWL